MKITIKIFLTQNNNTFCKLKSVDECEKEKIIIKNIANIELEDSFEDIEEQKRRFEDFEDDVLKKGKKR